MVPRYVRSIQRIERGQACSLEALNSLAAVFEVERSILNSGEIAMARVIFWRAIGWGAGLVAHGPSVYEVISFLGPDWERKHIEKRLGRSL